jgi:hypothetical protein
MHVYNTSELALRETATGTQMQGRNLFCESGAASSTWAQNVVIAQSFQANESWWLSTPGRYFDYAFPLCSTTEPLEETISGAHDAAIIAMFQAIAAFDPSPVLRYRPGWEANSQTAYPWSYNSSGRAPTYVAALQHVIALAKSVDRRFKAFWILLPGAGKWDPTFDWTTGYPGDGYLEGIGADPYHLATFSGWDAGRAFYDRCQGTDGMDAMYQFGIDHGLTWAFPENASHTYTADWNRVVGKWTYDRNVAYVHYWDRPSTDYWWDDIITDGRRPLAVAEWSKWYGSLAITTPASINVTSGVVVDIPLDATAACEWTLFGSDAALFTLTADKCLEANLAPGTYSLTIKAANKRNLVDTRTLTITADPATIYPAAITGMAYMVGPDGAPARNPDHTFVIGPIAA